MNFLLVINWQILSKCYSPKRILWQSLWSIKQRNSILLTFTYKMWQTVDVDWNKSFLLTCKEREPIMLADNTSIALISYTIKLFYSFITCYPSLGNMTCMKVEVLQRLYLWILAGFFCFNMIWSAKSSSFSCLFTFFLEKFCSRIHLRCWCKPSDHFAL